MNQYKVDKNRGLEMVVPTDPVQITQDTHTNPHVQELEEGSDSETDKDEVTPRRNPHRQTKKILYYTKKNHAHFGVLTYEATEMLRTDEEFIRSLDTQGTNFGT